MEDLSDLFDSNMLNLILDRITNHPAQGPTKFPGVALWRNLVRLTDQGLREYEAARKYLESWIDGGHNSMALYFRAIDALEQSVVASHRATLMAKGMKKLRFGRGARLPTERRIKALQEMRNIVVHTDDRLVGTSPGRTRRTIVPISAHEAATLWPLENRLELGAHQLKYADLAGCLKTLYTMIETVRGAPSR